MPDKRLGKGLEALITTHSTEENERIIDGSVSIKKIIANRNQPRQEFNEDNMNDLMRSIKRSGILQPLTLRELEDDTYELVAGERRLRAAEMIGMETVPAYIISIESDVEMMEYALVENIQRVDLNPIEEAEAFAILSGKFELSHDEIADRVGKNRSTIANSLRLLKLPPEIKSSLKKGAISAGHARAILRLKKSFLMISLFRKIVHNKLSVRQAEVQAKKYSEKLSVELINPSSAKHPEIVELENTLISIIGTKVTIQENKMVKEEFRLSIMMKMI